MKNIQLNINKLSRYKFFLLSIIFLLLIFSSCKKQLNVNDPNDPTFGGNVNSEAGLTAYAQGGIYWNGFSYNDAWLGDSYFSLPWGYHELMGDVIGGGQGSNNQTTTLGVPDKFQADPNDPSTTFINPSPEALGIIRAFNDIGSTSNGNNVLYYEWVNMYAMINACNLTLEHIDGITLSADKAKTIMAWCYWWKGFAYAQIGTLYYAGLIYNNSTDIINNYKSQDSIITESNRNLNLAITTLNSISNQGDYAAVIAELVPAQNQVGLGMPPSSAQWVRTINTMMARNILLNHLAPFIKGNTSASIAKASIPAMSGADWQSVLTLCKNGIQKGDYVFTGRTSSSNSFFSATGGSVAGLLAESNQTTTYKLSERIVQEFKTNDKRRANFSTKNGTFYGDANTNSTRYTLLDGAVDSVNGVPVSGIGVPILGSREPAGFELYIGPTFEENELMLAEANIRNGSIETGLGYIDEIRSYQGAGVAAVKGTGLTLSQAMQELTMERLAALALRGLSFYDIRRWGWTYSIANGGGRYGCTLIYKEKVYTNATIDYNFMDYWDVPADETTKNAPSDGSVPVVNPNY